jgi:galactose mutarotase-like enzyme
MEEGFPGELRVCVTYELRGRRLTLRYEAATDQPTVCSLTNHSFFNLAGVHSATPVLAHTIRLAAPAYTPVDATAIPLGPIESVEGTLYDLTAETVIGSRFDQMTSKADETRARVRPCRHGACVRSFVCARGVRAYIYPCVFMHGTHVCEDRDTSV